MRTNTAVTTGLERKAYRPAEVAKTTGLSKAMIYLLVAEGRLRSVRMGRAILIPATAVEELLTGEAE